MTTTRPPRILEFLPSRFPGDPAFATCVVTDADGAVIFREPAQGTIAVPENSTVILYPNEPLVLGWIDHLNHGDVDEVRYLGEAENRSKEDLIEATERELAHIGTLTWLRSLSLKGQCFRASSLGWLRNLVQLRDLRLGYLPDGTDPTSFVGELTELRSVQIRADGGLDEAALMLLADLPQLQKVDLSYTPSTCIGLEALLAAPV